MFKRFLNGKSNTITSAAVIVASFSILSRFVGFIRDRILAGEFGASDTLDIYFAAFRVPDLLFQLLVVGALSASFIPLFTRYVEKKQEEKAWQMTNNLLNILAVVFGVFLILAAIFAHDLAPLIAPGFDPAKQSAVADMARVMFLAQFILSISMVYGSVLQSAKRFVLYSSAPIFYNLGIILGAIAFVPILGPMGLAWGVVLGAILHLLIQIVGVYSLGYKFKFTFQVKDPDVKYTLKHMIPRVMGLAVNQVNFLVMTILASTLAVGSVTIIQFAYNLNFFPVGVIAVSYAVAAFPTFCELAHRKDQQDFINAFSGTIRQILFFIIPASVLFLLLRAQIVRVVLGAGAFDWEATILTADTLGLFALSFFAQSLIFVIVRAYFAKNDTLTPFVVGLVAALINVAAALTLTQTYGVVGLAMAYSIAVMFQLILLWAPLRARVGSLDELRIARSLVILSTAGIFGGLATQGMKLIVVKVITLDTFFAVFAQGFIAGMVGLAVYVASAYMFKSEELSEFVRGLKKRLFKKAHPEETVVTISNQ
ncbi:MAG: murein biosynthesis integral membrane protein MurJ [Candidatus Uhrbacteria bacterium]|nr:murein biosynthesis integral membrane protein MurJ [Candidatus Uhrbacteria bacterium]